MKANEAPEKIYYAPYGDMRENAPITDNDIEYVREDAFIEKAGKWLDETLRNTDFYEDEIELIVQDFKKAIKL